MYMFQCCSLKSSHPCLLPQSPKVSFAVSHISHIFSSHTLLPLEAKNPFSLSYHFSAHLLLLFFSHLIMSDSFVTPWTVAPQVPLSMGFPRQEYWSGLPFPSSGDLPDPEIKPMSPALAGGFFTNEPPGKPIRDTKLYRGSKTHHHPSDLKIFSLSGYTPSHLAGGLCSRKALGTQLVAPGRGRGEEL